MIRTAPGLCDATLRTDDAPGGASTHHQLSQPRRDARTRRAAPWTANATGAASTVPSPWPPPTTGCAANRRVRRRGAFSLPRCRCPHRTDPGPCPGRSTPDARMAGRTLTYHAGWRRGGWTICATADGHRFAHRSRDQAVRCGGPPSVHHPLVAVKGGGASAAPTGAPPDPTLPHEPPLNPCRRSALCTSPRGARASAYHQPAPEVGSTAYPSTVRVSARTAQSLPDPLLKIAKGAELVYCSEPTGADARRGRRATYRPYRTCRTRLGVRPGGYATPVTVKLHAFSLAEPLHIASVAPGGPPDCRKSRLRAGEWCGRRTWRSIPAPCREPPTYACHSRFRLRISCG